MKVLDLFSGIGGFSLGLERAGMNTVAFCEIEPYPRSKLKKHWPQTPRFRDIKKLNKRILDNAGLKSIQLICGGFPCQPFSVAGKQEGEEDDRHLWPEMFRLIREIKPKYVIGENVAGFIPMALDDVLSDLESEGYRCEVFVLPACSVGGVHRRDRVWIVANTKHWGWNKGPKQAGWEKREEVNGCFREECNTMADSNNSNSGSKLGRSGEKQVKRPASKTSGRSENALSNSQHNGSSVCEKQGSNGTAVCNNQEGKKIPGQSERVCSSSDVADTINPGLQRGEQCQTLSQRERSSRSDAECCNDENKFRPIEPPTESPVRHRDDGLPDNVARLKALGNAVVPQLVELIGRAIMEIENENQ